MSWLKNDIHLSLLFFSQRKWKQRHNFHLLKKIRTDHQWPSSPDSNYTDVSNEDYVITYPFDVTARSGGTNNTAYVTSGDDENDFAFNQNHLIVSHNCDQLELTATCPDDVLTLVQSHLDHNGLNQRSHDHGSHLSDFVKDSDVREHDKSHPHRNGRSPYGGANAKTGEYPWL